MKSISWSRCSILSLAVLSICAGAGIGQTQQARDWFNKGVNEKEPEKKIAAYLKAIEADPSFIEAYYNLGLTYKAQQNYAAAEQVLHKAYTLNPEKTKSETKLRILFELGTTYRRLGRLADAEEALLGAKGLAIEKKARATLVFELGRTYAALGRYDEAIRELQEGRQLDPANAASFDAYLRTIENEKNLVGTYNQAVAAQEQGKYAEALQLFMRVRQTDPSFRDIAKRMQELQDAQKTRSLTEEMDSLYAEAARKSAAGDLEGALATYDRLRQKSPTYKDVADRMRQINDQLMADRQKDKLEYYYTEGLAHLRRRNWTQAMSALEAAAQSDPNYRDVKLRLSEAQKQSEKENQEALLGRYYMDGLVALQKKDFAMAINAFQHVQDLNPHYRDAATRLADARAALERAAAAGETESGNADVERLYQDGLTALQSDDYVNALVHFEKLEVLSPHYKDLDQHLAQVRRKVSETTSKATGPTAGNAILLAGLAALIIVLPVAGLLIGSPAARARLLLLQGNYARAASIYERLLAKNPARLKLYPILANIYLLEGRTDEMAIKVFKMILQLNLLTHRRDDINAIVAQRYLSEGRKDKDALNVLEDALRVEMRKLEQSAPGQGTRPIQP